VRDVKPDNEERSVFQTARMFEIGSIAMTIKNHSLIENPFVHEMRDEALLNL
jgi:hypothetical protein